MSKKEEKDWIGSSIGVILLIVCIIACTTLIDKVRELEEENNLLREELNTFLLEQESEVVENESYSNETSFVIVGSGEGMAGNGGGCGTYLDSQGYYRNSCGGSNE